MEWWFGVTTPEAIEIMRKKWREMKGCKKFQRCQSTVQGWTSPHRSSIIMIYDRMNTTVSSWQSSRIIGKNDFCTYCLFIGYNILHSFRNTWYISGLLFLVIQDFKHQNIVKFFFVPVFDSKFLWLFSGLFFEFYFWREFFTYQNFVSVLVKIFAKLSKVSKFKTHGNSYRKMLQYAKWYFLNTKWAVDLNRGKELFQELSERKWYKICSST